MSFGKRLSEIRKSKGISQSELADMLGSRAPVIGRYEREEARPSVDVANRIAELLNVSLDYLVGNTDQILDQDTLKRLDSIAKLPEKEQQFILKAFDGLIRDAKNRIEYA